jgi:protocatechuate 3,4-dioxygenase beta subunit
MVVIANETAGNKNFCPLHNLWQEIVSCLFTVKQGGLKMSTQQAKKSLFVGMFLLFFATFVFPQTGSIVGRVTDSDGNGISDMEITVKSFYGRRYSDRTDDDGYYEVKNLLSGKYKVFTQKYRTQFAMQVKENIEVGEGEVVVNFVLKKKGSIVGLITTLEGEKIFAKVKAISIWGAFSTETDNNGNYEIKNLPAGVYKVIAELHESYKQVKVDVEVKDEEETVVNFVFAVGSIVGKITMSDGSEIRKAWLYVKSLTGFIRETKINANGNYEVKNLPPGIYEMVISPSTSYHPRFAQHFKENIRVRAGAATVVDIVLKKPGKIVGRVTTSNGEGLYDITVGMKIWVEQLGKYRYENCSTDYNGNYELERPWTGTCSITAAPSRDSGFAKQVRENVEVKAGETTVVNFVLRKGGSIVGRVTTLDGRGVRIGVDMYFYKRKTRNITDIDGNYKFEGLKAGFYTIRAGGHYYIEQIKENIEVKDGEETVVNFVLIEKGSIVGQVTTTDGEPIPGAKVFYITGLPYNVTTDANGNYRITPFRAGVYTIKVYHDEFAPQIKENIEVKDGEETVVNFVLIEKGSIVGQVTTTDGEGVPGAKVKLYRDTIWYLSTLTTDTNGNYKFEKLFSGLYRLKVSLPSNPEFPAQEKENVEVKDGEETVVNFVLIEGRSSIFGKVTFNSGYTPRIYITATDSSGRVSSTFTDANGNYEIKKLLPGIYKIRAEEGYDDPEIRPLYSPQIKENIEVKEGERVEVNFVFKSKRGSIIGRVTTPDGEKAPGVTIRIPGRKATTTNADGNYKIYVSPGIYSLVAELPPTSGFASQKKENIEVKDGEETVVNFVLKKAGSIVGRVITTDGKGIKGLKITSSSGQGGKRRYTQTDINGDYKIEGLTNGLYNISLNSDFFFSEYASFTKENIEVREGEETVVNFVLKKAGSIVGQVTMPNGKGVEGVKIWVYVSTRYDDPSVTYTDANGNYKIKLNKAGFYKVETELPSGLEFVNQIKNNIKIEDGKETVVNFVLQEAGSIVGRVTDPSGNPVSYVIVKAKLLGGGEKRSVETNSNGNYKIKGLSPGIYKIEVTPTVLAYQTKTGIKVSPGEEVVVNFELQRSGRIRGRVDLKYPREIEIEDIRVQVFPSSFKWSKENLEKEIPTVREGKLDDWKNYCITHLSQGDYKLLVVYKNRRQGFYPNIHFQTTVVSEVRNVSLEAGEIKEINLTTTFGKAVLTGNVLFPDSRKEKYQIWLIRNGELLANTNMFEESSSYSFEYLTSGRCQIICVAEGYETIVKNIVIPESGELICNFDFTKQQGDIETTVLFNSSNLLSYPNPFNSECWIPVNTKDKKQNVKCKIYNILGQLVREIEISNLPISKSIYWDGKDSRGMEVPAGVYFYEIAGEKVRRMVVLK